MFSEGKEYGEEGNSNNPIYVDSDVPGSEIGSGSYYGYSSDPDFCSDNEMEQSDVKLPEENTLKRKFGDDITEETNSKKVKKSIYHEEGYPSSSKDPKTQDNPNQVPNPSEHPSPCSSNSSGSYSPSSVENSAEQTKD